MVLIPWNVTHALLLSFHHGKQHRGVADLRVSILSLLLKFILVSCLKFVISLFMSIRSFFILKISFHGIQSVLKFGLIISETHLIRRDSKTLRQWILETSLTTFEIVVCILDLIRGRLKGSNNFLGPGSTLDLKP